MNLILHQLRTDFRAHRWTVLIALLFALAGPSIAEVAGGWVRGLIVPCIVLSSAFAVFAGLKETPLVGDRRFWPTRPISRKTIFATRSLWLLLMLGSIVVGILIARRMLYLTPYQLAVTSFLSAGWVMVVILLAANLRAASETGRELVSRISLAVAVCVFSFVASAAVFRALGNSGAPTSVVSGWLCTLAVSIALLGAAWLLVSFFRRPKTSMMLTYITAFGMPWLLSTLFSREKQVEEARIATPTFTLIEPDEFRAGEIPEGQVLWENIVVSGLQPGEVFAVTRLDASITPEESWEKGGPALPKPIYRRLSSERSLFIGERPLREAIEARLPSGLDWFQKPGSPWGDYLTFESSEGGDIEIKIAGLVHEMLPLAHLPVREGESAPMEHGGRIELLRLTAGLYLTLELRMIFPTAELHGLPRMDDGSRHLSPIRDTLWCALVDPESGAALAIDPDSAQSSRDNHAIGIQSEDMSFDVWLPEPWRERVKQPEKLELHVVSLQPVAHVPSQTLKREDYRPVPSLPEQPRMPQLLGFEDAKLSASPDRDEIERFLDTVIFSGPDSGDSPFLRKFRQLPDEGLPLLMDRMPLHETADRAARTVLVERADAVSSEACLDALRRDSLFVELCVKKGLEAEAAEILRPLLRKRQPLLPDVSATILRLVAKRFPLDDTLAADLGWHFVRAGWSQYQAIPILAGLEGFDFEPVLSEAWRRCPVARHDHGESELAPYALRLGDREALRLTLLKLRARIPEHERERVTGLLGDALPPGRGAEWAERHFEELRFDASSGHFTLP